MADIRDLQLIPNYLGPNEKNKEYDSGEAWLEIFMLHTQTNHSSNDRRTAAFAKKMAGEAQRWFNTLTSKQRGIWDLLKEEFRKYARPVGLLASYLDAFTSKVQTYYETAESFLYSLKELQKRQYEYAYARSTAVLKAAVTAAEAVERLALSAYQANTTVANEQTLDTAITTTQTARDAIPGIITDSMVRNQFRSHLVPKLSTWVKLEYDKEDNKELNDIVKAVTSREQYLILNNELKYKFAMDKNDCRQTGFRVDVITGKLINQVAEEEEEPKKDKEDDEQQKDNQWRANDGQWRGRGRENYRGNNRGNPCKGRGERGNPGRGRGGFQPQWVSSQRGRGGGGNYQPKNVNAITKDSNKRRRDTHDKDEDKKEDSGDKEKEDEYDRDYSNYQCNWCEKYGHIKKKCWQLHPELFNKKKRKYNSK